MEKKIKYLVLPDSHGRTFWKEPVKQVLDETDAHIVFLGDYLDPYPYEFEPGENYRRIALDLFKEILQLKRDNPQRITLLLGNHDCTYTIGTDICDCRRDRANYQEIVKLFEENREIFQIAEETTVNGKHFIFSHAGILKGWARQVFGDDIDNEDFNIVDSLNDAWLTSNYGVLNALGDYDSWRGWGGYQYGSPIWSDIRSWCDVKAEDTFGFNVVGHTQLEDTPVMFDQIVDLDLRRAFYIDDEGVIRKYSDDSEVKPSIKNKNEEEEK